MNGLRVRDDLGLDLSLLLHLLMVLLVLNLILDLVLNLLVLLLLRLLQDLCNLLLDVLLIMDRRVKVLLLDLLRLRGPQGSNSARGEVIQVSNGMRQWSDVLLLGRLGSGRGNVNGGWIVVDLLLVGDMELRCRLDDVLLVFGH